MKLKVFGDFALFCRPEYKAEPHSYPVMTPSAAIGLLEAIFWKPEFHYVVHRIMVLNPIRYMPIKRNMLTKEQSPKVVQTWVKNGGVGNYLIESDRVQRMNTVLKDPAYVIEFNIQLNPHANESIDKYLAQLRRRIDRGQCYKQPFFGTREFPAFFEWADGTEQPHPDLAGIRDLGMMPRKLHFVQDSKGAISWQDAATRKYVKGKMIPEFFEARLVDGILEVV